MPPQEFPAPLLPLPVAPLPVDPLVTVPAVPQAPVLPLVPDPCTVRDDVIVPHRPTVFPGLIGAPDPQLDAVLKNVAGFALPQLLPSPDPAAVCATKTVAPPLEQATVTPVSHASIFTGLYPAASAASAASV